MYRKGFVRLQRGMEALCTLAFVAIFGISLLGIVMRYVFSMPLVWTDELAMVLLLWVVLLTDGLLLSDREQVRFDVVYDLCGPRGRRGIGLLASLAIGVTFLASLPTIYDYVAFLWRERTSVLDWRLDAVFSCFVVYWVAVIVRAVIQFWQLLRPDWRERVADDAPEENSNILG
ncbi:hypothetical protein CDO46_11295 [Pigmentiphaga sp. NML030171]|jgi:TRAP-type C4-dicarboxylate transport system permease small subunit|nr:hypothetical protein CDO44_25620 [Pigmentiphaga sp. NML080357]OVZ63505.1 hypothetical protein CDO46_11295 [Pigmentiphaga sp. NML030171]